MRAGIVFVLFLAGCATAPAPAPEPAPRAEPPTFELPPVDTGMPLLGVRIDADGQWICPNGKPILSGYITDADLAPVDADASWMPEPPLDWDTYFDKRRENVDKLRANAAQTATLQAHAKDVLVAARQGRFCEAGNE